MDDEDLILEGVKNSIEAGAINIDIYIDGNAFAVADDGILSEVPDFKAGHSSKGERRGRGLFLLKEATGGRCSIEKEDGKTVLRGVFAVELRAEEVIPFCFNLTGSLTYHSMRDGHELYRLDKHALEDMGIDPSRASDIARLKKIIREKEQRS